MTNQQKYCASIFSNSQRRTNFELMLLCALTIVVLPTAQAQTFSAIYNFSGGQDGATPYAGLTMDKAGNFYGTTFSGGKGLGTVYRLKRSGSSWVADGLYSFRGGANDAAQPLGRVSFGPDGSLYGTASVGGPGQFCGVGCGGVFKLQPPATFCRSVSCPWIENVYLFGAISEGEFPSGDLAFDEVGNLYGTTYLGGRDGGNIYELIPSGGGWTESVVHGFSGSDGLLPYGGAIFDSAGNLYGTTQEGGYDYRGTVFQFKRSGSGWTGTILFEFQFAGDEGIYPSAGLIFDQAGNLYGATTAGGAGGGGAIFELSPAGGGWAVTLLYSFTGSKGANCPNPGNQYGGAGPWASLAMDGAGSLYGTTLCDGANHVGNVFKLSPSGAGWTYTLLHDFTGGDDGKYPISSVIVDANGNLYGTASGGGSQGHGVVWEITP